MANIMYLLIMEHLNFNGKYHVFTKWSPKGMTLMANIMYLPNVETLGHHFNGKYYVFTNDEGFETSL